MYRAIGFLVVAGFALFGVSKFVEDHVVLGEEDPDEVAGDTDEGRPLTLRVVPGQDSAVPDPA